MRSTAIASTTYSRRSRRTRLVQDTLIWVTSYAGIRHAPGIPLFDFMNAGKRGDDPRMYFSWYGGDFTTDPALADATPEERANPSLASFGKGYLDQQRRRLPTHKFRRLHLNLPGAPDGAAFDGDKVMGAIVIGRKRLAREDGCVYFAFVDMSGGSLDEAVLGISHFDAERKVAVLDVLIAQTGAPPFNPRDAVRKFAAELKAWGLSRVTGDAYAGQTFRRDFEDLEIVYSVSHRTKSEIYDAFEPKLNAGEVELLDHPKLTEKLLTLVLKNGKIDHLPGDHDDHANGVRRDCAGERSREFAGRSSSGSISRDTFRRATFTEAALKRPRRAIRARQVSR